MTARRNFRNSTKYMQAGYEARAAIARITINMMFLLNGGACIAVLAFLGKVWSAPNNNNNIIPVLLNGIKAYSAGVILAGLCSLTAYISMTCRHEAEINNSDPRSCLIIISAITHILAVLIAAFALVAFVCGCYTVISNWPK